MGDDSHLDFLSYHQFDCSLTVNAAFADSGDREIVSARDGTGEAHEEARGASQGARTSSFANCVFPLTVLQDGRSTPRQECHPDLRTVHSRLWTADWSCRGRYTLVSAVLTCQCLT